MKTLSTVSKYFSLTLLFLLSSCYSLRFVPEEMVQIPQFEPKKEIGIALVLGGGGSKGLAHLGAIQELEREGIRPDLIIGCSAGAIAGALYADRSEVDDAVNALLPLKKKDILDYSYIDPLYGIVHGEQLQNLLKGMLHAKTFEELKIPLIVIATDLITGEVLELTTGELSSAIRASCAFPGFFKPVPLYGRYCVDGGASCPIPVNIARKYGARFVIAIDLSEKLSKEHPRNLIGVTKRSLEIGYLKFIEQSLSQADIAIRMNFDEVGTFTDDKNEWLFEQGREAIRSQLPAIKEKLGIVPANGNKD